jgi:uncharacterized protein
MVAGLAIPWGGTALLISPAARSLGDPARIGLALVGQGLFWILVAAVVAVLLVWEKQPLGSLWLRPFQWRSVVWGLGLVAAYYVVLFPAGELLRRTLGLSGFGAGMERVTAFPVWYRVVAVLGAGIGEEVLFRGFSVTRLAALTGRVRLGAAISLVAFCALHVPWWGWGFAAGSLVSGAGTMAFFLWRRDLTAMMMFHVTVDALGIVVIPMFNEWWKMFL